MNTHSAVSISRREARRQVRREAILDVAHQWFVEHGYAGTTMSAIAAALGGSKGTLWSYFPSKEELFEAVLDRSTSAFRAQLSLVLNPTDDVETALRRFCFAVAERISSPLAIEVNRLAIAEVNRFPEIGRIVYERGHLRMQALLAEYLGSAMDRGLLRRADPGFAAQQLIALCTAGTHRRLLIGHLAHATSELIAADAQGAVDVFTRAYAPEPPSA